MADPATTPLGKMLLDEITPVVMVLDTPLVEEACRKNGLSFVEMLSPFCVFNNIDVPVRTASDQPYRLQKFRLRLFYASGIRQPNWEVARERLKQVIMQAGEKDDSELCSDPSPIENVDARFELENLPLWFDFFNEELVHSASFSDHEAFDHPVACLLVVSSKDEQPINQFVDLFNTNKLPSLLNDGAMDPKILKHYLLVHDNQDGTSEKATKILTEMRSTFGSDCQLLCINSSLDTVVHQYNPWVLYKPDASSCQNLGCFLNVDDVNEMRDIMQELTTKQIIPCMEQKIRVLNQQVSATRKGFKNQIKNLWWRKGKDEIADSSNDSMYTFSSIESQIRLLGDYAFMLRDYELALSNYRLISTDYKLDKAWKRYAGIQEMMGLAYFLLDQSRKEAEYCMENAFTTYLKLGPSGQQNAIRCGLWWVQMLKTRDQFREAATVYFRICGEEPLQAAVMLEQASYCYLLSTPPMLHKYGFHLVLSGERYRKSDQIKHAIRTYKNAISVYRETTWSHIKDHVYFNIGQWYAHLGRYDLAVSNVLEVLACSHQSKTSQDIFLKHFLQIVQKTGKIFEVPKLQLPEIKMSSLGVIFEDYRTYASPTVANVKESIWRSLEEDLIPSLSTARTNWLELHSKLVAKKYKESNVCVAGEAVRVAIEFRNPLQIPISVSGVSLLCELSASSDETESDANSQARVLQNDDESNKITSREMNDNNSIFTLSKVDFSLEGGEIIRVQLTVTPRVEGILQIVGVRWNLSGAVVGFHNFESNPRRKKSAKGGWRGDLSPSDNLKFVVIKSLPKLEGFIQPLPTSTYAGDVRHLVLELRNQSECGVKNLKLKVSHPRFLKVGSRESLDLEFPACLEKKTKHQSVRPNPDNVSQPVFIFPEDTVIKAETPLLWPIWFRAAVPGNISLYLTVYYEIEDTSSTMRYRTLRMHHNVQVLPSLDISFQVSPCPSKLEEFLVQMDVVNRTGTQSFQVHQLSSVGEKWEISLLQPVDTVFPSQCLVAGQALSCFFMLKNQRKSGISADNTTSTSAPLGSVVKFGPQGSAEPLFDTSSSPLADFHHNERLHQEILHQGDSTVDFILISRLLKNDPDSGTSVPLQLFSHHSCHCGIASRSPISWLMDGPRTMYHNFSNSFCEIKLSMTIYNSSKAVASVHIYSLDSRGNSSDATFDQSATSSGNQAGWHDVSLVTDIKVTSDVLGARFGKPRSLDSVSPFIWSASSSTRAQIKPMSTVEIPLQICVFSPGTYDLSNYLLHWNLLLPNGDEGIGQSSGTCQGYPYFLTVLQSA